MTSSSSRWIGLSYIRYAFETPRQTMALPALPAALRVVLVSAVVIEVVLTCEALEQIGEARLLAQEEVDAEQEKEAADDAHARQRKRRRQEPVDEHTPIA